MVWKYRHTSETKEEKFHRLETLAARVASLPRVGSRVAFRYWSIDALYDPSTGQTCTAVVHDLYDESSHPLAFACSRDVLGQRR